jgi:hypothetical protein
LISEDSYYKDETGLSKGRGLRTDRLNQPRTIGQALASSHVTGSGRGRPLLKENLAPPSLDNLYVEMEDLTPSYESSQGSNRNVDIQFELDEDLLSPSSSIASDLDSLTVLAEEAFKGHKTFDSFLDKIPLVNRIG